MPRLTWKDRAAGAETPNERFCRHNGIPYRGGHGTLAGTLSATKAANNARVKAVGTLMLRIMTENKKES